MSSQNEHNYGVLLYGPRYIGTTTFAEALPDSAYIIPDGTWEDFKSHIELIKSSEDVVINNIIIDKVTDLYELCIKHICEDRGVDDVHDLGTNKWSIVEEEYKGVMYAFSELPGIKWYIAGERADDVNTALYTGTLINPALNWMEQKVLPNITSQTLYLGVKTFKREIDDQGKEIRTRVKPSRVFVCSPLSGVTSGDNLGILPQRFPAGSSGEEAVSLYFELMKGPKDNG
jgi:hypothetical protein